MTLPGSTTDLAARMLLQQAGMIPGKDIQITHLQGMPDMITALSQGRIDAGIVSAPTTLKAKQAGYERTGRYHGAQNIPMIHAGLATTRDFIKSNPDKVRRYVQAYIEANKIARTDAETTKQVIGKWTKTDNKEDLDETYNTYVKAWEQAPYVSGAAMQTVLNFAINPNAQNRQTGAVHRQLVCRRVGQVRLHQGTVQIDGKIRSLTTKDTKNTKEKHN